MQNTKKIMLITPESLPVPPVRGGAVEAIIYQTANQIAREFDTVVVSTNDFNLPITNAAKDAA